MSHWKPIFLLTLVCLLGPMLCPEVCAQSTLGSIRGTVTDELQGALVGASVTATNLNTGISRSVFTDAAGRYALLSLPAAPYSLMVELSGFTTSIRERIILEVAQTLDTDFALKIAGVEERIVVTGEVPLLNKDSAELGAGLDPKRLVDLPINGRDFTRFSLLAPGAVATQSTIAGVTFNGLHATDNSYTMDGIDASMVFLPFPASNTFGARLLTGSLDSIQEFRVHTANYQAEFGRASGAVINIVTKAGGNQVHGTLFEFLRDSALDARNFFAPPTQPKPLFILHQFGGNISGPIVKNKTFYFVNYEGSRQHINVTGNGTVPSQALRQRALNTSPALAPLLATIPVGTSGTSNPNVDNYTTVRPMSVREDTGSLKVDHRITERDSIFTRYNVNDTRVLGTRLQVQPTAAFATDSTQDTPFRTTNITIQEQHTFSTQVINEVKVGMQRVVDQIIFGSPFPGTIINGVTIRPGYFLNTSPRIVDGLTAYQVIDNLSISHGTHTLKSGFEIRHLRANLRTADFSTMSYSSLDDFVRNSVFSATLTPGTPGRGLRQTQFGLYLQDDWKARRNLSLNLGLRYEYYSVFREVRDRVQSFNLLTGTLDPPGAAWYRPDQNNFAPRFGFAWSPRSSDKTMVRGGFGLYYQSLPVFFLTSSTNIYANNLPGSTTLLRDQIPTLSYPLEPFVGTGRILDPSVIGLDPQRRDVYTEQWTLSVQQLFGANTVLQVAYVGNRGINLYRVRNINLFDPRIGRRSNPRFTDIIIHENTAQSVYHSMQASLRHRLSRGLSIDAAYTYGHAIDDVTDTPLNTPGPQDSNNLKAERGNGSRDIRHNLSFSLLYDLPIGPGRAFFGHKSGVVGQLWAGWQVNGLGILRTGIAQTVELGGESPSGNLNTINQRPDRVAGVSSLPAKRSIDQWLNRAAFAEPRRGTFGNLGRNTERGPGFAQFDFSLLKTTKLDERKRLQFRAEFFNVPNHPNFAVPSAVFHNETTFGKVLNTFGRTIAFGTPRQIQFGLKFLF